MHPIFFQIGPLTIRYYGLFYAIALSCGFFVVKQALKLKNIKVDEDTLIDIVVYTFIAGIIGARVYYVLFNLDYYLHNPGEILAIWHGGLAIHGAIIVGFLFGIWFSKKKKIATLPLADSGVLAVILGQAIGRWGNFFNGDAHGLPTKMAWGLVFPKGSPAGDEFPGIATHPVMIYESLLNLGAFFILYNLTKRNQLKPGTISALYIIFYSIIRFVVSFFRADSLMIFDLRAAHLISIAGLLLGSYLLKIFNKKT